MPIFPRNVPQFENKRSIKLTMEDKMARLIDGVPVLQGIIVGSQVHVWCEFCRKYHFHGWPEPKNEISHGVAHCINDDSPYQDTGYFIEVKDRG